MPIVTWSDAHAVQIKEIDDQHQGLVALLNDLHDAMKAGKSREELGKLLGSLVERTEFHFHTEERLFRVTAFKGGPEHVAEHTRLIDQVHELQLKYESGQSVLTFEVLKFLRTWLMDHITGMDKLAARHLTGHGVR
jgi:hemerythrin